MEANQILQSGFLDILFDGRNKLYGAYDLRKTYNQRISRALLAMLLFMLVLMTSLIISKKLVKNKAIIPLISASINLKKIAPDKPATLPRLLSPVHTATVQVTPPVMVKELEDPPPDIHQIEAALIGIKTIDGPGPGIGIVSPPGNVAGNNVIVKPVSKSAAEEGGFKPVELEARFPGGAQAWQKYMQKAIEAQLDVFSDKDYGTCVVKFRVDTNGNVSNVEATTMKDTRLAEIAVNTIRKGPKWIPAMQNGQYVTADRYQPVTLLNPNQ